MQNFWLAPQDKTGYIFIGAPVFNRVELTAADKEYATVLGP
jgi:hypothetical protein